MTKAPKGNESLVAREGLPFMFLPAGAGLCAYLIGFNSLGYLLLIAAGAIALFFRNPRRYIPAAEQAIVAPADGRIIDIADDNHKHLEGSYRRISIFLSVFDVHINRYPCTGTVVDKHYNRGKYLAAFNDKASLENEQCQTILKTSDGTSIMVNQIAGLIARRIVTYAEPQQSVERGEQLGLIRFGSRTDLWIPRDWHLLVHKGQRVRGGESILSWHEGATS